MKESEIQKYIVALLREADIKVSASFNGVMIPTGSDASLKWKILASMKSAGLAKGFPDLFVPVPAKGKYGLFMELKTEKGIVSEEQKEWLNYLNKVGYEAVVCKGVREAIECLEGYLDTIILSEKEGIRGVL